MGNSCVGCKYEPEAITSEPCFSCIRGLCDENTNRSDRWDEESSEVFNNEKDN